jgi:hypothetical protein
MTPDAIALALIAALVAVAVLLVLVIRRQERVLAALRERGEGC